MTEPSANDVLNSLMSSMPADPGVRASIGNLFLRVTVAVPSRSDPATPGGFDPLVVDRGGVPFMVVLTSPAALNTSSKFVEYALQTTGLGLVRSVVPGVGLLLDNGTASLAFPPDMVAHLKERSGPGGPQDGRIG